MSYRGPQPGRIMAGQREDIFRHAGQTATWMQYISASADNPALGLGDAPQYREQLITALLGKVENGEMQTPAGMIAAGQILCVTRERIDRDDALVWRGETYRVESDPAPGRIAQTWITILQRGSV